MLDIPVFYSNSGGFVPSAPSGAAFAVAVHPTLCRSDAGNTTPCTPGDGIRWWYDLVSGLWFQQSTSGARFVMRQAANGKYYAEAGPGRFHTFGWVPDTRSNGTTYTYGVSVTGLGATNRGAFFNAGTSTTGYAFGVGNTTMDTTAGTNIILLINGVAYTNTSVSYANGRYMHEVTISAGALSRTTYLNGTSVNTTPGGLSSATAAGISIGFSGDLTTRTLQAGNIYGVCGYSTISSGTRSTVDTWLQGLQ